jgi:hypothetical protein
MDLTPDKQPNFTIEMNAATGQGGRTLLDELAPNWDVRSWHTLWVGGEPTQVYLAARHADLGRSFLVRVLMAVRATPAVLAAIIRGRHRGIRSDPGRHGIRGVRFTLVAEVPGQEFVLGLMGRFWTLSGGLAPADPEHFRKPPPPGQAQAFWSIRVVASGGGTELLTETRVRCGDEISRRQFTRYWRIVRLGSGLVRRSILRQIRDLAEQRSDGRLQQET